MEIASESSYNSNEECNILLADNIHKLSDRLNKVSIIESTFVKSLEEWRNESHEIIDNYCKLKYYEYMKRTN